MTATLVRVTRTFRATIEQSVDIEISRTEPEYRSAEELARQLIELQSAVGHRINWSPERIIEKDLHPIIKAEEVKPNDVLVVDVSRPLPWKRPGGAGKGADV